MSIDELLDAAGVDMRRSSSTSSGVAHSVRYAGVILLLEVQYVSQTVSAPFAYTYTYRVAEINSPNGTNICVFVLIFFRALKHTRITHALNHSIILNSFNHPMSRFLESELFQTGYKATEVENNPANASQRLVTDRHGVKLFFVFSGALQKFDTVQLLIHLVTSLGLLSVANIIVDSVMTSIMPRRQWYKDCKVCTISPSSVIDVPRQSSSFPALLHLIFAVPNHG